MFLNYKYVIFIDLYNQVNCLIYVALEVAFAHL